VPPVYGDSDTRQEILAQKVKHVFGHYIGAACSLEGNLCLRQSLQIAGILTRWGEYGTQGDRIDADTGRQLIGISTPA
jgi:hypothetical protein